MGLFDKKYCDICGEKIGLLGNRKLEDGNLCKDCAKKLTANPADTASLARRGVFLLLLGRDVEDKLRLRELL